MIEVDGHEIALSHADKVLFPRGRPDQGRSDRLLPPHRAGHAAPPRRAARCRSQRYPDGITANGFMQKNAGDYFPELDRARARSPSRTARSEHVVAGDAATLAYLANQAAVTLHVGLARIDRIDHPDRLVIDLDPSDDDFAKVKRAARAAPPPARAVRPRALRPDHRLARAARLGAARAQRAVRGGPRLRRRARRADGRAGPAGAHDRAAQGAARRRGCSSTWRATPTRRPRPRPTACAPGPRRRSRRRSTGASSTTAALGPRRYTIANLFRRLGQKRDPWAEIERHARPLAAAQQRLAALPEALPAPA